MNEASERYRKHREECGIKDPVVLDEIEDAFYTGMEWGMKQAEIKIQAQSMAVAHGCPKEPVSENGEVC